MSEHFITRIADFVCHSGKDEDDEDILLFLSQEMFELATFQVAEFFKELGHNVKCEDGDTTVYFPDLSQVELAQVLVNLEGFADLRPEGRERAAMWNPREGVFIRCCCFLEYCLGYQTGFDDEYDTCCDCCRLISTQSNEGRYRYCQSGELVCLDCDKKNPEKCLEEILEHPRPWEQDFALDPETVGYYTVGNMREWMKGNWEFDAVKFERGLHLDQRDNPKKIWKRLKDAGIESLFSYTRQQFDVTWTVAVKPENMQTAFKLLMENQEGLKDKEGPGDIAKQQLQAASIHMQPQG